MDVDRAPVLAFRDIGCGCRVRSQVHLDEDGEVDHQRVEMDNNAFRPTIGGRIGANEPLIDLGNAPEHLEDTFGAPVASSAKADLDRKSTRLNSRPQCSSRMPSSASN